MADLADMTVQSDPVVTGALCCYLNALGWLIRIGDADLLDDDRLLGLLDTGAAAITANGLPPQQRWEAVSDATDALHRRPADMEPCPAGHPTR